ncbi:MAG: glycosyltransferase [Pseudomonadota bacterium]
MSSIVRLPAPVPVPAALSPAPRVLVIGSQYFDDTMEWHTVDAARALGCTVDFFAASGFGGSRGPWQKAVQKCGNLLLREPERRIERRLARVVEQFAPQVILVLLGNQLSPKTVALLRTRTRAPIVCWCQDQMTTIGRQYLLGAGYDAVFVKDRYLQEQFGRMLRATQFHYLPEACNPRVHRTLASSTDEQARYRCEVMIAGTVYYYRQEILRALGEFDLRVYGNKPGWLVDRLPPGVFRGEVRGDEKVHAARAATVALNTLHYAEVDGLNCRAFELAGIGAFQIVDFKPVLAEHFRPGEEIETFRTPDELVAKIRHYVRNPDKARAIAAAGQRRAHREHTYEARLRTVLDVALGARQAER